MTNLDDEIDENIKDTLLHYYSTSIDTDKAIKDIKSLIKKKQMEVLDALEEVINNTPTDKNNMEYFILLHKAEIEKEQG